MTPLISSRKLNNPKPSMLRKVIVSLVVLVPLITSCSPDKTTSRLQDASLTLSTPSDQIESDTGKEQLASEIEQAVKKMVWSYNTGDYSGALDGTCGQLYSDLMLTNAETFLRESELNRDQHGNGAVISVSAIRAVDANATAKAEIQYARVANSLEQPSTLVVGINFLRENGIWKICTLNS
ncbi:MAG: hypothetical protein ACRCSF_06375 [Mycobacteriaceae bacterium]